MKERIRIVYVISRIDKSRAFEWLVEHMDPNRFELIFVILNHGSSVLEDYLEQQDVTCYRFKLDKSIDRLNCLIRIWRLLLKIKPDIVHAHLIDAGLVGITAAWLAGVKKRIYTRHYSMIHHNEYKKGLLLDYWINRFSTQIIAISETVRRVLTEMEGVLSKKVILLPHGFDLGEYQSVEDTRIRTLRINYGISESKTPIIGVISRYIELKGIQYIIPAFQKLLISKPTALLVLANAHGDFTVEIQQLLRNIPSKNYIEIEFEEDIQALYNLFDVFIHVPVDPASEAFGQTYVEALAAGIPSIFTLSGIANDFIQNEQSALVVDYQDSDQIYQAMLRILEEPKLKETIVKGGLESVQDFDIMNHIRRLEELYA